MIALDKVVMFLYTFDIMFAREHRTRKADGTVHIYLGLARSFRRGPQVHQEQICRLGRLDRLQTSGQLDRLIRSLARYSRHRWVTLEEAPGDGTVTPQWKEEDNVPRAKSPGKSVSIGVPVS